MPELKALREGRKTLERLIPSRTNRNLQPPLARAVEEGDTSPAKKGAAIKGIKARSRFPRSRSSDSASSEPAVRAFKAHLADYHLPDEVIEGYATTFHHDGKFVLVRTHRKVAPKRGR